ncbi:MAG: hypothetical protein FJ284_06820 [Planctomycetes bacterium]|nr:hypothetical protein [Planctomycetota bacterium]MBM4058050.1 hypothetical protein [Planctomycetota bacterium]
MKASKTPATIVLCATVGQAVRVESVRVEFPARGSAVPVTWIAPWESLAAAAELARGQPGSAAVIDLPPAAFESRRRLRSLLARGRKLLPGLDAVAIRGPVVAEHRSLLVEEGIRGAVVESLGGLGRGSRRPAPSGWRCRNAAWGLWEVELAAPRHARPWVWLGIHALTRPTWSGLHVLRTDGLTAGHGGNTFLASRLARWIAWAGRHIARGTATAVSLPGLVSRLSGEEQSAADRSVLRAA